MLVVFQKIDKMKLKKCLRLIPEKIQDTVHVAGKFRALSFHRRAQTRRKWFETRVFNLASCTFDFLLFFSAFIPST